MTRLEKWTLHTNKDWNGSVHEYLTGFVFGHPKADWIRSDLIDGHFIRTSEIASINLDIKIAITQSGTVYHLGAKSSN